jgi:hypothetical protein
MNADPTRATLLCTYRRSRTSKARASSSLLVPRRWNNSSSARHDARMRALVAPRDRALELLAQRCGMQW